MKRQTFAPLFTHGLSHYDDHLLVNQSLLKQVKNIFRFQNDLTLMVGKLNHDF